MIITSFTLIVLLFINWGLESFKWKLLISRSENISFGKAFQAVLGGLAVSIFTPNRVGEFMGRVFILQKTDPLKAILLTIVGSFSQLLVTIVFGSVAYVFFAQRYLASFIPKSEWLVNGVSFTLITISGLVFFLYFNISALHRISFAFPAKYSERFTNGINTITGCSRRLLFKVLMISASRYVVFSVQFYLALLLTGVQVTPIQVLQVIPVIYLILTSIPTVALTEIGVRGSVAVFVLGLLAGNSGFDAGSSLAVVSATTLIWLVNIAVPSLAGVVVVFRLKFFRR